MLVLLALAAGCVDAASYLGLGEVLTAAMTGNTILLGLAIGQARGGAVLRSCVALMGFVLGAIIAAAIVERGARNDIWPRAVTVVLALELMVLVAFALGWHLTGDEAIDETGYQYALIGASGMAMGMQSLAVQRLGVAGVTTTYVTGTLTQSAVRLVRWLRSFVGPDTERPHQAAKARNPSYPLIVWLAYGAGAVAAGAVKVWWPLVLHSPIFGAVGVTLGWPPVALLLPILVVATVVMVAAMRFWRSGIPDQ